MATPALSLISRVIREGCMSEAEEWGINVGDMNTTEEKQLWHMLQGFYHSPDSFGSIPGVHSLRENFPNFVLCDDHTMKLDALCSETRNARLVVQAKKTAEMLASTKQNDPMKTLTQVHEEISRLLAHGNKVQDIELAEGFTEVVNQYKLAKSGKRTSKVIWPWPSIQQLTGGIQNDDFIVFYGRPKSMKSWVMCFLIAQLYLQGNNVLVYTKEMTPHNIFKRVVSCLVKLPYQALRMGQLTEAQEREFLFVGQELKDPDRDHRLTVLSGRDAAGNDTPSWFQTKLEKYKPDVAFIDGLYLMNCGSDKLQDHQRVMKISRDVRAVQLQTKIPIIATMQANRKAAQNKMAALDEIAYSDAIAQDATGVYRTIREKESHTIALVAGGNREYELEGIRIHGVPSVDFSEKEVLNIKEVIEAQENDKAEEAEKPKTKRKKKEPDTGKPTKDQVYSTIENAVNSAGLD